MLMQKEELIMTFRMYAGVRFNREISTETDAITVGGYEMTMDGESICFDFEEFCANINKKDRCMLDIMCWNPDMDTFEDLTRMTEGMLKKVTDIGEFFIDVEVKGNDGLKAVSLEYVSFVLPYDGWKELRVDTSVVSRVFKAA